MSGRRVILLRHGRTAWNAESRFQGQADPPLDDTGVAQAYEAAGILAAVAPDLLVSSDLERALRTAEIVGAAAGRRVRTHEGFRERSLGHWEGLTRADVERRYPHEYAAWRRGADLDERGGEDRQTVADRALAALQTLPVVPLTVIVTHSATAMSLTNALLGIPVSVRPLGPLANCHWTELYDDSGDAGTPRWRLRGHNLGAPGGVVPVPVRTDGVEQPTDADA